MNEATLEFEQEPIRNKTHRHVLKQKNMFDASFLKCELCNLTFVWDVKKQAYIEY